MRYTSHLEPMSFQPNPLRCAAAFLFFITTFSFAQTEPDSIWTHPAHDLVQQILETAGSPSSVTFDVENRSALTPNDLQLVRKAMDNEFRGAKVKVVRMESAVADIKFILSRNAKGLLWIAQVRQGTSEQTSMLEFTDPSGAVTSVRPALFQLQRTLLLSRSAQILDVAIADNFLLVLGNEQISAYSRDGLNATTSVTIAHSNPWPRDIRGRIFISGGTYTAFLPSVRCTGAIQPALSVQCEESDDPWPLLRLADTAAAFFSGARNQFSGVLGGSLSGSSVPPFFSAARLGDSDAAMWAFAGVDGSSRFYTRMNQPARTVTSLGSDLAAVQSNCGSRWQLLVTGDADETSPDILQAFEIQNRDATVVSDKMIFAGPVTALWSTTDPGRAVAITRNLGKESYEAYSITVACGR